MTNPRFEIKDGKAIIPEGTKLIDMFEFANCPELKELVVPEAMLKDGERALASRFSLYTWRTRIVSSASKAKE